MKRLCYLFMLAVAFPFLAVAQQKVITGKVTDAFNGAALPGVTITVRGAGGNTTTDIQGAYSITVNADAKELVFSYVGRKEIIEKIGNRTSINISFAAADDQLTDVVVIGYGSKRKETLTGAVSVISNKEIQTTTNISLAQKLQGKVAGLQIRQLGGEPGTFDNMINLRGFGTPLFVIDGVVRDGPGEFQRLNADDIESVSFLKDASAAIYGFGSANGVVIVTTKKGSKGKASFNYTGSVGFAQPTDVPRMANAAEWMQLRNDAAIFGTGAPFLTKEELQKWIDGGPGYESTDWYNVALKKTSLQTQHNLSASGGNDKTQYYVGLAFADEESWLRSDDMRYRRYNVRSNITTELVKNLRAEIFLSGRFDKKLSPGENFFNIFKGTRVTLPTEKPYANNNPEFPAVVTPSNQNPLTLSKAGVTGYSESVFRSVNSNFALIYDVPFVRGLTLRGNAAYDMGSNQGKDVSKPYNLYTYVNNQYVVSPQRVGSAFIANSYDNSNRLTLQAQANYAISIKQHNIAAMGAFEQRQEWSRNGNLRRLYDFYTIDQFGGASQNGMTNSAGEGKTAAQSVLGRFNYDFDKKYLLELSFRYQGTHYFPPESRWGFFPVISGGWRVSEEQFMKNVDFISNLKLRASYGEVGSFDGVSAFQWIPGFSLSGGGGYEFDNGSRTNGASAPGIINNSLTWINNKTTDIGFDLGLFKNKVNIEFSVYRRDREGILSFRNASLPNTFGASLPQENLNGDRTQGFDMSVTYNDRIGDLRFNVSGNVGFARSMNRYIERGPFVNSWDKWKNGAANRYDDIIWSYTYLGQFQSQDEIANYPIQNGGQANIRELPGDFKYADINNDGVVDGNDMLPMYIGANGTNDNQNPRGKNPKINFGLNLSAYYKGFDANLLIQGAAMYTVRFSEVYAEIMAFRGNTPAYFFDRWHKADPYDPKSEWIPGKWPVARFNGDVGSMYKESSVWRKDASYARLKSLELGYTFNNKLFGGVGIKKLRMYVSGFNLLTIADPFVKAFDPERLEGLFNAGFNYPLSKIYNVGINLNF